MTEEDAVDLLEKLKSFMENTNKQIEILSSETHNMQVDIDKLKRHIVNGNRIIVGRN